MQEGKLTLELYRMLLEVPVKYRNLEAVFVPVLPGLMTKLLQLTTKAEVGFGMPVPHLNWSVYWAVGVRFTPLAPAFW